MGACGLILMQGDDSALVGLGHGGVQSAPLGRPGQHAAEDVCGREQAVLVQRSPSRMAFALSVAAAEMRGR